VREWDELRVRLDGLGLPFLVAEADGGIAGYTTPAHGGKNPDTAIPSRTLCSWRMT